LLVALTNCGRVLGSDILETFKQASKDRDGSTYHDTLVRLLGRVAGDGATELLESVASRAGEVADEAAVFSLGRILGRSCHHAIKRYLGDERRFVAAATIEALAKYVGPPAWGDIAGSQYHRCSDTNTAFHRAVYYAKPNDLGACPRNTDLEAKPVPVA
jgi:hypothetical protein